jgi:hypothetical protein
VNKEKYNAFPAPPGLCGVHVCAGESADCQRAKREKEHKTSTGKHNKDTENTHVTQGKRTRNRK